MPFNEIEVVGRLLSSKLVGVSEILCKLTKVGDKKEVTHGNT